jgi:hypothetical protein
MPKVVSLLVQFMNVIGKIRIFGPTFIDVIGEDVISWRNV